VVIAKDQSAAEAPYNWHSFKAYERFDDFLQSLIVERKSYITGLNEEIDFDEGFAAIKRAKKGSNAHYKDLTYSTEHSLIN